MRPLLCALAALALLRAAGADAADPSRGDAARSTGCDTHLAVLSRLDVLEEIISEAGGGEAQQLEVIALPDSSPLSLASGLPSSALCE
ncbi:unnamed protein product [Pipistrellus nathusii]|uniref:Uncharacterized protein n=1 Tax=Pipistrellus nathusii TaxID=59473 RepID=A0ABN9ZJM6_PIPNA